MKKRVPVRTLLVLVLLLAAFASLSSAALAAFSKGQYFTEDTKQTKVSTVQVFAGRDFVQAADCRDDLLAAGYDSFVYQTGSVYRVMCGKFRNAADAEAYCTQILNTTNYAAYVTEAYLRSSVIQVFENTYRAQTQTPVSGGGSIIVSIPTSTPAPTPVANGGYTMPYARGNQGNTGYTGPTNGFVQYNNGYNQPQNGQVYNGYPQAQAGQAYVQPQNSWPVELRLFNMPFTRGQYFEYDASKTKVFSVQVSTVTRLEEAQSIRDGLLNSGYDSFVYRYQGNYCVMCGKFRVLYDACAYSESIHANTSHSHAYANNSYLPEEDVRRFEELFYGSVTINSQDSRAHETMWEKPSGPFYRGNAGDTVKVYTVQFSAGTSFSGSERNRDKMIAQGYPAFVYKVNLSYRDMTGMFFDSAAAQSYCDIIKANTDQKDAIVGTAQLPSAAAYDFLNWWYGVTK